MQDTVQTIITPQDFLKNIESRQGIIQSDKTLMWAMLHSFRAGVLQKHSEITLLSGKNEERCIQGLKVAKQLFNGYDVWLEVHRTIGMHYVILGA
jgi:hypothetical protein